MGTLRGGWTKVPKSLVPQSLARLVFVCLFLTSQYLYSMSSSHGLMGTTAASSLY